MSSYPSSRPLLPLISFEALQSSAVFCHSRHTSNFLICVGYHQNNISISKTNYPHHIPISKNLFDHTMIYQRQKVIGIVPAAIMSGSQKGSWIQTKVNLCLPFASSVKKKSLIVFRPTTQPPYRMQPNYRGSRCLTLTSGQPMFPNIGQKFNAASLCGALCELPRLIPLHHNLHRSKLF